MLGREGSVLPQFGHWGATVSTSKRSHDVGPATSVCRERSTQSRGGAVGGPAANEAPLKGEPLVGQRSRAESVTGPKRFAGSTAYQRRHWTVAQWR
jgi:hypothetical protein